MQGTGSVHGRHEAVSTGTEVALGSVGTMGSLVGECARGGFTDAGVVFRSVPDTLIGSFEGQFGLHITQVSSAGGTVTVVRNAASNMASPGIARQH